MPNDLHLFGDAGREFDDAVQDCTLLLGLSLIFRESGPGMRYTMEQFFASYGLQVAQKMELTPDEAVRQIACADGLPATSTRQLIWMDAAEATRPARRTSVPILHRRGA